MTQRRAYTLVRLTIFATIGLVHAQLARAQSAPSPSTPVVIPDNPAGRALKAWLTAFNTGDAKTMDSYYKKYEPEKDTASEMRLRNVTGGFALLGIQAAEPLHIEFLVK